MELKNLHQHIRTLATLEETNSPVISYYLNRESNELASRLRLTERGRVLRQSLWGQARHDFEAAMNQVEEYLDHELLPEARGVAIFARVNQGPFFLPLQFRVPLPNWLNVTANPNIYHLIELKDTYHRYVVMISTEESARILEVNLGAVTEELWRERPELRRRVGREWTREHYQNHRRAQTDRFIKEKIKVLEQLMAAGADGVAAVNRTEHIARPCAHRRTVDDHVGDMVAGGGRDGIGLAATVDHVCDPGRSDLAIAAAHRRDAVVIDTEAGADGVIGADGGESIAGHRPDRRPVDDDIGNVEAGHRRDGVA